MDFAPYHKFGGCAALQGAIGELVVPVSMPELLRQAHDRYHYSLVHKLRSARYHVESLGGYLKSEAARTADPQDVIYRVNFHFDGFVHVTWSAFDIFAREVLAYFGVTHMQNVYYHSAHRYLSVHRAADPLLHRLLNPAWKKELGDYRNTATHENVVGIGYNLHINVVGGQPTYRMVFPLPDDPRAILRTYKRNADIVEYCTRTFKRSLTHVNVAYTDIATRIRTQGLPL